MAEVKKHPTDTAHRGLLCELLCFAGDWERADKQLETIVQQDPGTALGLSLFRQVIRAEAVGSNSTTKAGCPSSWANRRRSCSCTCKPRSPARRPSRRKRAELLAQAEEQRPHPAGTCDGQPFDDLRDLDDLTAAFLEVLTSTGKYYWIPMERVQSHRISPAAAAARFDLAARADVGGRTARRAKSSCRPCTRDGTSSDDQLRLGRGTDWQGEEGQPVRGLGQRMFLAGAEDRPILSLQQRLPSNE